jgi:hypothetical protein
VVANHRVIDLCQLGNFSEAHRSEATARELFERYLQDLSTGLLTSYLFGFAWGMHREISF